LLAITTSAATATAAAAAFSATLAAATLATTCLLSAFVALTAGLFIVTLILVTLIFFCHFSPSLLLTLLEFNLCSKSDVLQLTLHPFRTRNVTLHFLAQDECHQGK